MFHQKLIFILLVSFGHGDETGHWCKGESQRNYEVIVSPRLVDSVPCLELYRSGKIYLCVFPTLNEVCLKLAWLHAVYITHIKS